MKIVILDITARNAVQYNPSLCEALACSDSSNSVTLLSPKLAIPARYYNYKKLLRIIPDAWELSTGRFKRVLRALEVVLNYLFVSSYILVKRPDIIHIQWLPFLEFSSVERLFVPLFKVSHRRLKIVLTVHNLYPHNMSDSERIKYKKRFGYLAKYIDAYIVHLKSTKERFASEFSINKEKVFVSYHGIYVGRNIESKESLQGARKSVILYGYQSHYKGADLVVKAYGLLPKEERDMLLITIVGKTDDTLFKSNHDEAKHLGINWINQFVSDEELYSMISSSDLILLPYREISQSGVLLLALSYKKPILTSDLPSFLETLDGYPLDCFFKSSDAKSLAALLSRYIKGDIDEGLLVDIIGKLNIKYSWEETAKSTIRAYSYAMQ